MSQVLIQSDGQKQLVDRTFVESALPAIFSVHAGQKVLIDHGQAGKPQIRQHGKQFFYEDGAPVTKEEDITHLPEPYRGQALAFIRDQQGKPPAAAGRRVGFTAAMRAAKAAKAAKTEKVVVRKPGTKVTFRAEDALGAEALRATRAE